MYNVNYTKFLKHAHKITKKVSSSRPILKGVHHTESNEVIVTDSHRIYYAKNVNAPRNVTLDVNGMELEGKYPNIANLLPQNDPKTSFTIDNLPQFIKLMKAFKQAATLETSNGHDLVLLYNDRIWLDSTELEMSADLPKGSTLPERTYVQIEYILEALEFLKDMSLTEVTFNLYDSKRPLTITTSQTEDLLVLMLPVRKDA